MVTIHLVRVGAVPFEAVTGIGQAVEQYLRCAVALDDRTLDPSFAFNAARGQYWSTEILRTLEGFLPPGKDRVLGIAEADLFIPVLTFVFGEAFLNGIPALVSLHRLHTSFYGLPEDPALLMKRAQTEAVHELGHTFGLVHCPDYACVMHVSRVADEIDLKSPGFCSACAARLAPQGPVRPQLPPAKPSYECAVRRHQADWMRQPEPQTNRP